jgi:drug/metabolite transporter (DMT)-like permease
LEPGLAYGMGIIGLSLVTGTQAVIIQSLEGFMIVGIARLIYGTPVKLSTLCAGAFAVFGVGLVSVPDLDKGLSLSINWGLIWIAGGTFIAAIYVVLSERIIKAERNSVSLVFWQVGAAYFISLLVIYFNKDTHTISYYFSPLIFASGAITYALSFVLYLKGMKSLSISLSGFLLCLTPVFGASLSVFILGEKITPIKMIGILIVTSSIAMLAIIEHFVPGDRGHRSP